MKNKYLRFENKFEPICRYLHAPLTITYHLDGTIQFIDFNTRTLAK